MALFQFSSGGAIGVLFVVVEDEAVAELLGTLLAQLLIVLVGRIGLNGGDVALAQVHLVQLAALIQLQADGTVADHGDSEALKAADVGSIVVVGVGDVALGVALDVLLHHIGSVVPHGGVVAAPEAIDTQLLDQSRGHGVEAVVGGNGIKVGAGAGAGEHQSVIIRSLNAHTGSQHVLVGHVSGSVTGFFGQLVVLVSAHNGIVGHGGVVGLVLDGVHHPFKTNQEVLAGQVSLHLTVAIHPVHVVPQVEGPDSGILIVLPAGSDGGHHLAVAVKAQQAVPQVGDHVGIFSLLGVQHVPAFQLTIAALKGDEFLQGGSASGVGGQQRRWRQHHCRCCWTFRRRLPAGWRHPQHLHPGGGGGDKKKVVDWTPPPWAGRGRRVSFPLHSGAVGLLPKKREKKKKAHHLII